MKLKLKNTYSLLAAFAGIFVVFSFLLRLGLTYVSFDAAELSFTAVLRILAIGFLFDLGVVAFFCLPYSFYLLFIPASRNKSILNKLITYTVFFIVLIITILVFFAEVTFWNEFESRFNFIAVDYLVYTYEVVNNINQSYPLPLLLSLVILIASAVVYIFHRRKYFLKTFSGEAKFFPRLLVFGITAFVCMLYGLEVSGNFAERGKNRYQDELTKAGIYSFFSAFKNNELSYEDFYRTIDNNTAFQIVRRSLEDSGTIPLSNNFSIRRDIAERNDTSRPNVIMVVMESFSADFMARFGNQKNLTPVLDSIAGKSILFTRMFATGTRTVRGMEALSLAIPPTPGSSIVRRQGNENLATIGSIFRNKGYETAFFYGGDGYFDNMNKYFGDNGYEITDKGRNILMKDKFAAPRNTIPAKFVRFENAWGICDEDLYGAVIRDADAKFNAKKAFYDFVMLTSNHRPYTYPAGTIDIPSGTGRDGAVKYTDYAIGQMLQKIKTKPWFKNTVIIFVADHCAGSAGKNEIDVSKYHIPAMIYNLNTVSGPRVIDKLSSQIDLYPTLFHLLGWNYRSSLYGQNVLASNYKPRAFLGTYQKLAYLKGDSLVVLSPQRKVETFRYSWQSNEQLAISQDPRLMNEAIANYQTAYYLFKRGGLKLNIGK